ncbi:MAG TPA: dephospho-CoA kinase [Steroidobacteraceae bacterium]|nr:dephospho-CoA kinase [Steroidobacteraceae bacterium]
MPPRLRIGLTGGIASGKSTVAGRFRELGVPVIDADEAARRVVAPGEPGLEAVVRRFGKQLLTAQGELDRAQLRARIFADEAERRDLEALLHPLIRADMARAVQEARGPYVVLAIPLLVEGARRDQVDRILVIDVDEETQRARLKARDGASDAQARAILAAQATRAQRLAAADDVLTNTGSLEALRREVDQLHERYLTLARRPQPSD